MCRRFVPTCVYLTGAYYHRPCLIWGHWLSQVFSLTFDFDFGVLFDVSGATLLRGGDLVCDLVCA